MSRQKNLQMPGNPRYQPKELQPYFGYDNGAKFQIEIEWALLVALDQVDFIPQNSISLSGHDENGNQIKRKLLKEITTTMQVARERGIDGQPGTKHDIVALVQLIKERLPIPLQRWVHFGATSYDILDNARIIAFKRSFKEVILPDLKKLIFILGNKAEQFTKTVQIGRTHGQHALPITIGFWLATVLNRLVNVTEHIIEREADLRGKFSGAVGAYNAQVFFGLEKRAQEKFNRTFEELVLDVLGLKPSPISTQILPPEPLARFLHEFVLLSGVLAQLARDCRHLQRSEIGEIFEGFTEHQAGSSTMAHKRNPIKFENTEGMHKKIKAAYLKVIDSLISEHQRDLTDSSVFRDFPEIIIYTYSQIKNFLRKNESGLTFFERIQIDREALQRNFEMNAWAIIAEPVYLALILAGYEGDAHKFVNHTLIPIAKGLGGVNLMSLLELMTSWNKEPRFSREILEGIPVEVREALKEPEKNYLGRAEAKALEIVQNSRRFIKKIV